MVDPVRLPEEVVADCILRYLSLRDTRAFLCASRAHARTARHPVLRRRGAAESIALWYRLCRLLKFEGHEVWVRMRAPDGLPFCRPTMRGSASFRKGWVVKVGANSSSPGRSEHTGFALSPTCHTEKPVRYFDTLTRTENWDPDYLGGMGTYVDWIPWTSVIRVGQTLEDLWEEED